MALFFEWDPGKARASRQKHNVSFEEASTIFGDSLSTTIADDEHSRGEERLVTLGMSYLRRLLVVVHTERHGRIRIITARRARPRERRQYEDHD
jgi:uncharacterized protein